MSYDVVNNVSGLKCLCGGNIVSLMSNDGECVGERIDYWMVDNFNGCCDKCDYSVNYKLPKEKRSYLPVDAYEVSFYDGFKRVK